MSSKLVTIGVPCFNGADYLAEALDSIRKQDHQNLQIIVADNASTDSSVEIAENAADDDDRITVIGSDENRGAAWNYNRLLETTRGEYFKWAAHDDVCEPTFVSSCVAVLDARPEVALVHPESMIIDGDGNPIRDHDDNLQLDIDGSLKRAATLLWNVGMCHAVFGVIRTDVLRETPLIQPFDSSDVALLAELALRGPFVQTDGRLFLRRRHDQDSRRANSTSSEVAEWFDPKATQKGRTRPLLASYMRSAWNWAPNRRSGLAATAMFAVMGPLTELRFHRRHLRKRLRKIPT